MSMKIKLNEDTVKFKVWYKWFGEKGYEYVYADGPYAAEDKFIEKERYKDHPKELLRVETPGTIITRKKESKQNERNSEDYLQEIYDSLASAWDKSKFNLSKGYDPDYDCQCIRISLKEDPAFYSLTYVIEPGDANFVSGRPTAFQTIWRYPNDHGVGVGETLEFQSTDFDDYGIEVFDYFDEIQKLSARKTSFESKQDEADYSTSRVSKPIADAYSLLDEYFCDEDGRLTSDAVDKVYMVFRNERDLVDMSTSRRVKSHSLAWSALIRQINATLEWDDENPHATSLTSEQVKNWFKLKGRDYKEELKPLVAVIDAYRNREY